MFSNSFCEYENNFIISGACACPGKASGRLYIWKDEDNTQFMDGDIILITNKNCKIPPATFKKASGVISCFHTTYSHLSTFAMSYNIPCIVGTRFSSFPHEYSMVYMYSFNENIGLFIDGNPDISCLIEKTWFDRMLPIIHDQLQSTDYRTLIHVMELDDNYNFFSLLDGIFFDATICECGIYKETINRLNEIKKKYPSIEVYYRFSHLAISDSTNQLFNIELSFVYELLKNGINTNVFVANSSSVDDIIAFRNVIFQNFSDAISQIGTMVEDKNIVNALESISDNNLIDFAVVGVNDLISSILSADRDDPKNQPLFMLTSEQVNCILQRIYTILNSHRIPCYISFPKYPNFFEDYFMLTRMGYRRFFGTKSMFTKMDL